VILQTTSNHGELFTYLGYEYHYIGKNSSPDRFNELVIKKFGEDVKDRPNNIGNKIYAFILYNHGKDCKHLYNDCSYYVFTDSGVHFQELSLRPE
jgi:hypothetical protein